MYEKSKIPIKNNENVFFQLTEVDCYENVDFLFY